MDLPNVQSAWCAVKLLLPSFILLNKLVQGHNKNFQMYLCNVKIPIFAYIVTLLKRKKTPYSSNASRLFSDGLAVVSLYLSTQQVSNVICTFSSFHMYSVFLSSYTIPLCDRPLTSRSTYLSTLTTVTKTWLLLLECKGYSSINSIFKFHCCLPKI